MMLLYITIGFTFRFVDGSRVIPLTLYNKYRFPLDCIGPAMGLWKSTEDDTAKPSSQFWLRVHPVMRDSVLTELSDAAKHHGLTGLVEVSDITLELVSFELTGDQSTSLLQTILRPSEGDGSQIGAEVWKCLGEIRTPASLSSGVVIGMEVEDPRLKFPQKVRPKTAINSEQQQEKVLANWPKGAGISRIWDRECCDKIKEKRQSEQQLNDRRHNHLVPGEKLEFDEIKDVAVPLLLIQRSEQLLMGSDTANPLAKKGSELSNGWLLVVPSGWGMSFWLSLVFAGARTCGLREQAQINLEAKAPSFPRMWPGTAGFEEWVEEQARERWERWHKRPPAKRINYGKCHVPCPFYPDLGKLTGMADGPGVLANYTCENRFVIGRSAGNAESKGAEKPETVNRNEMQAYVAALENMMDVEDDTVMASDSNNGQSNNSQRNIKQSNGDYDGIQTVLVL